MSYESELNPQAGKSIIKPSYLAFILSLLLHLLVYRFGLPSLNLKQDGGKKQVAVIELNAEQQSRLPNLYPELDIPQVPDIPPDDSLPAPPFALPPELTPGINGIPDLPPIVIPPPPNFDIPPLPPFPPSNNIKLPPIGDLSSLPLPPPLESLDFKPQNPTTEPNAQPAPQPPTEAKKPESKPKTEQQQPKPEVKTDPKPEPSPQEIAAIKEKNLQQEVRRLSGSLQKNETGTSNDDANRNYLAWWNKIQTTKPEEITIEGTYPRDACIRRLEGESAFGILVNEEGTVVSAALIKGAKYPIFNQQGSKDISQTTFKPKTEKSKPTVAKPTDETIAQPIQETKPYLVTVAYKYDPETCPSLTLPSLRKDEEQKPKENTATPKPETPAKPPEAESEKPAVPAAKPETTETPSKPESAPPVQSAPKPKPAPKPTPVSKPKPAPKPPLPPLPSLRERLRDVPLPDRKPSELKDIPLPDKPRF